MVVRNIILSLFGTAPLAYGHTWISTLTVVCYWVGEPLLWMALQADKIYPPALAGAEMA